MNLSDYLSRHFIDTGNTEEDDTFTEVVHTINVSDEKLKVFQKETKEDDVLRCIVEFCRNGWPNSKTKVSHELKFYYRFKEDIFLDNDILFFHNRIIVPKNLRQDMLKLLHETHSGIIKTKLRARELLYWPGMDTHIENVISKCELCQLSHPKNTKEPCITQDIPMLAFNKVTCDILELHGKSYLVLIDYFSKWIELILLKNKSSSEVIRAWLEIFSRFGFPKTIIADNVPFNSFECRQFASSCNIEIITSSPNYPKGHGLGEKAVHICKGMLNKSDNEQQILLSLLEYRNCKVKDLEFSPSQLLQNRRCRTKLPITDALLQPRLNPGLKLQFQNKTNNYKKQYDKNAKYRQHFNVLDRVIFRLNNKWVKGTVIKVGNTPRSYIVRADNMKTYRRNSYDMRRYLEPLLEFDESPTHSKNPSANNDTESINNANDVSRLRSGKIFRP